MYFAIRLNPQLLPYSKHLILQVAQQFSRGYRHDIVHSHQPALCKGKNKEELATEFFDNNSQRDSQRRLKKLRGFNA